MSSDRILQLKLTEQLLGLLERDYAALGELQLFEVFQQVLQLRRQGVQSVNLPTPSEESPDASASEAPAAWSTRPVSRPALARSAALDEPATRGHARAPAPSPAPAESPWQQLARRFDGKTPQRQWTLQPGLAASQVLLDSAATPGDNVLFLKAGALSGAAVFQTGSLVEIYLRDPDEDEPLVEILARTGLLGPEQRRLALEHAARYQVDIDEAILRERFVSYPHVLRALQQRVSLLTRRLLRLQRGSFSLYHAEPLPRRYPTPPVSLFRLSYQVAREDLEATPPQFLLERLSPLDRRPLPCPDAGEPILRELRLSPAEAALFSLACEGEHTLAMILSNAPMGEHASAAALGALHAIGLLRLPDRP